MMVDQHLYFEGKTLWIHDHEIRQMYYHERVTVRHVSFVPPLSRHSGTIILTENNILLEGDESEVIPLASIEELYYGFDDLYTASSVKNFGMFWKPLRLKTGYNNYIYLIINFNHFFTANERFLKLLKELLL